MTGSHTNACLIELRGHIDWSCCVLVPRPRNQSIINTFLQIHVLDVYIIRTLYLLISGITLKLFIFGPMHSYRYAYVSNIGINKWKC